MEKNLINLQALIDEEEKDLADYFDDVKNNVRNPNWDYQDYMESRIAAFKELQTVRAEQRAQKSC